VCSRGTKRSPFLESGHSVTALRCVLRARAPLQEALICWALFAAASRVQGLAMLVDELRLSFQGVACRAWERLGAPGSDTAGTAALCYWLWALVAGASKQARLLVLVRFPVFFLTLAICARFSCLFITKKDETNSCMRACVEPPENLAHSICCFVLQSGWVFLAFGVVLVFFGRLHRPPPG